jgi:hypothetical protein
MGRYFGDLISPSIRTARHISSQPLTLSGVRVWMHHAVVNRRRGVEAAHHLVASGLAKEAAAELCCPEHICGMVKSGQGFEIIPLLAQLLEPGVILDNVVQIRCDHYYRWLRKAMTRIVTSPSAMIMATGGDEPLCSVARQEIYNHIKRTATGCLPVDVSFNKAKAWLRSIR